MFVRTKENVSLNRERKREEEKREGETVCNGGLLVDFQANLLNFVVGLSLSMSGKQNCGIDSMVSSRPVW